MRLVGIGDDSDDEFDTPEQSPICDTDDPAENDPTVACCDDPPDMASDSHNWEDDDTDDVRALIDTGAMVTCTGDKHVIHHCKPYTKLRPCPIWLEAALSNNKTVIP